MSNAARDLNLVSQNLSAETISPKELPPRDSFHGQMLPEAPRSYQPFVARRKLRTTTDRRCQVCRHLVANPATRQTGCGWQLCRSVPACTAKWTEIFSPGGTSWVPDIYKSAQAGAVRTFFEQNGYIDYAHASKMGLPSNASAAKVELTSLLPGGLPLSSAIVAPALIDQLDASVEEALSSESW